MKITLPLEKASFDDNRLPEEVKKDLDWQCEAYVFKDEASWEDDDQTRAFAFFLKYGKNKEKALMFDVGLDDLEMFANSLLKSIEMFRRDYADTLKEKIKKGGYL